MSDVKPVETTTKKRGCSPLLAGLLGCGCLCVVLVVGGGVAGFYFVRGYVKEAGDFATEFEQKGYERVSGQALIESGDIEGPRVYFGQMVQLKGDVEGDIAFAAQIVEIEGTVNGNIDFYGQVLSIKPGAVVKGDINSRQAQVIQIEGSVEGQVTGSYMVLEGDDRTGIAVMEAADVADETSTDDSTGGEVSASDAGEASSSDNEQ